VARDYAAEYEARNERAIEHGFESYAQERGFRTGHSETVEALREEHGFEGYNQENLRDLAFDYESQEWRDLLDSADSREEWGSYAHDYIEWMMDEWGMTQEEAERELYE
jgi:hypothetical protein